MSDTGATPSPEVSDDEVERLRQENEKLREQLSDAPAARPRGSRGKSVLSAFLVIVACLLAPLSVTAVWANGEVSDTERYVETVAPLASDPDIQAAVSARITQEIFKYVNVEELTNEAVAAITSNPNVPPKADAALKALAGPVSSGIESFITSQVTKIVESPQFATAWVQANTIAHQQLVAALSGQDNGAVEVQNNEVTLNLGDIVNQVKTQLVANGFTIAEKIPSVDASIVLFQSDSIGKAQAAYTALDKIGFWLPILVAILAIIAVFVANMKHVVMIGLGVGLMLSMAVSGLLVGMFRVAYLDALPSTVNHEAATTLYDTVVYFLKESLWAGAVAGLVLAIGGVLIGPGKLGTGVRGIFVRLAEIIQRELYKWGATMTSARALVKGSATVLRIIVLVVAIGFILIQEYKTVDLILWTTAILLVVLFVIQIFASDAQPKDEVGADSDSAKHDDTSGVTPAPA